MMQNDAARIFRFAPSPNGALHLGHACSALLNHDMARDCGGTLLLRMEDTDTTRCKPEYEQQILEDLHWLSIRWEQPVRRQSDHFPVYNAAVEQLEKLEVAYPAALSRREIADKVTRGEETGTHWPRDPDGAPFYPGNERSLDRYDRQELIGSGKPFAWRLDIARAGKLVGKKLSWQESGRGPNGETGRMACQLSNWGDVVLCRSDRQVAYHLAVVVDDALQNVTDIVRGHDLFHATAIHRLLQALLDLPQPRYFHHHLLADGNGRKLSKSNRDLSLRALRVNHTPAEIRALIDASPKI
jgi:glutamyl-Q tRNA(Asp) synthetase